MLDCIVMISSADEIDIVSFISMNGCEFTFFVTLNIHAHVLINQKVSYVLRSPWSFQKVLNVPEQISKENMLIYTITLNGKGNNLTDCYFIALGCPVMEIKLIGHHIYRYYNGYKQSSWAKLRIGIIIIYIHSVSLFFWQQFSRSDLFNSIMDVGLYPLAS